MELTPPDRQPLTTEELVRQLYEQHDAELHAIFTRMIEQSHDE